MFKLIEKQPKVKHIGTKLTIPTYQQEIFEPMYRVTLVTLTKCFRDPHLRSVLQKYMVAKMSQFPYEQQRRHAHPFCKTTPGTGGKSIAQDCMQV